MMPNKLKPTEDGLSAQERAVRTYGTLTHFIAMHLDMGGITICPKSWDGLRACLLESGAHFGTPPEVEDFDVSEHEGYVPEVYAMFRLEVLASAKQVIAKNMDTWPQEHIDEVIKEIEKLVPDHVENLIHDISLSMVVRDSAQAELMMMMQHRPDLLAEVLLGEGAGATIKDMMNEVLPD